MDQLEASKSVLAQSQHGHFPYQIQEMGLTLQVNAGVFSPKHFNGWRVFTRHFPDVVGRSVLEIGCGHGATSIALAKRGAQDVLAVDINPLAVENTNDNIRLNKVQHLVRARISDIYSALSPDEHFDYIYWNTPFIYVPEEYKYASDLERGLFDPGYQLTDRFIAEAPKHLKPDGSLLLGHADFGDEQKLFEIVNRHRRRISLIASEVSSEINAVEFKLYEIRE